ncbi:hypothetical protein BT93_H3055 [Corymbia citriodora subsp. variegata]|nr:hypothetical protein BT93_H3055 [Corymbia citriodora subsp. variegata]
MFRKRRHHFLIIGMAPSWLVPSAIIAASLLLALPSHSLPSAALSSATPPALTSEPLVPPFQGLSPDITPLLPSPGGAAPASGGSSSIPTIPSTPSPPNPDDAPLGPGSSVVPEDPLMASSATAIRTKPVEAVNVVAFSIWAASWAMQLLKM